MIAIIGAGMAGLSAAHAFSDAGINVRLFDKGRGPGGRMSTRRTETVVGEARFDHGAQYLMPESTEFKSAIKDWIDEGAVAEWNGKFVHHTSSAGFQDDDRQRFVGVPGMNGIIRSLSSDLDVEWGRRVSDLSNDDGSWSLVFENGDRETGFQTVIIATPLEQARELYASAVKTNAPPLFPETFSSPVWALMIALDKETKTQWDAASFTDGPIAWMARNSSKPQRGDIETWVIHASHDWSCANLERDKIEVAEDLLMEVKKVLGDASPIFTTAHRWRYSQIKNSPNIGSKWIPELSIGLCGDWCLGPLVEHAWLSGQDIVNKKLELNV